MQFVDILHFLQQSDGDIKFIEFFDNQLLNFIIYEIYFEERLKNEGFYQDLLNFVKDDFKEINFDTWIELKLEYDLTDEERSQMLTIKEFLFK